MHWSPIHVAVAILPQGIIGLIMGGVTQFPRLSPGRGSPCLSALFVSVDKIPPPTHTNNSAFFVISPSPVTNISHHRCRDPSDLFGWRPRQGLLAVLLPRFQ